MRGSERRCPVEDVVVLGPLEDLAVGAHLRRGAGAGARDERQAAELGDDAGVDRLAEAGDVAPALAAAHLVALARLRR